MKQMGWPVGGGELGELVRRFDWSRTGIGPIADWPPYLCTTVDMVLASPIPIITLWGPDGIMIYNDAYAALSGDRHPDILGAKVLEGWPEVADFNRHVLDVGLAGDTLAFRDQHLRLFRHGASEDVWMNLDYSPIRDESGKPVGVLAIAVETTGRVRAEAALREANAELAARLSEREVWITQKDTLLREVNHRVKNGLQLVSSVLAMQARQDMEPAARAQFASALARVAAITSVHERLYREDAPLSVPLGAYLRDLCRDLAFSVKRNNVSVEVNAREVELPDDQAVPVALIVNELVTNALTHGLPEGGTVQVGLTAEAGRLLLAVEDQGAGMLDGRPLVKKFGLRLVDALLRQISGTLVHERLPHGHRVTLSVPRAS